MAATRPQPTAGFTLTEALVACAICTVTLAGICSTYVLATRGFAAIANYRDLHRDGRLAIDLIGRDLRAASQVTAFSPSNIVVVVPTAFNISGGVTASKTVAYTLQAGTLLRADSAAGTKQIVTDLCNRDLFTLYDKLGSNTTVTSVAKGVQVELKFRKSVVSQIQSEDFLSARLDMRNVP